MLTGSSYFTINGTSGSFYSEDHSTTVTSYDINEDTNIYLDGDLYVVAIYNYSGENPASIGGITTRAQPIIGNPNNILYILTGDLSKLDLITGNYIKTNGKEFNIGTLTLENTALGAGSDTNDRDNIAKVAASVGSLVNTGIDLSDTNFWTGLLTTASNTLSMAGSTYLNVTTLEFNDNKYSGDQIVNIGTADLNYYSMLRLTVDDYYAGGSTSVNFGTVNMDNITGIGIGLYGGAASPNNITINNLIVNKGGNDFSYAALLSSSQGTEEDPIQTVKIGSISITNNTLDLAGTPAQTLFADLNSYLADLAESNSADYQKLINALDGYAQKIDAGMNNGILFKSISDALKAYVNKSGITTDLSSVLEFISGTLNDAWGYVNGITLSALDSSGHLPVYMNYKSSLSGSGPQIKIGEVAEDTWVDIYFNAAAMDNNPRNGYAVMLSGSVGEDNTPDENYVIELHYTDGYGTEADAMKTLNELAAKVGQTATVVDVDTTDESDPVKEASTNNANYADKVTMPDGQTYTRLLVSVDPTGFSDTVYTKGLTKKDSADEDGKYWGYEINWSDDYSREIPSTAVETPSTGTTDDDEEVDDVDDNVSSHRVVNDAKQALLDPSVYTAMLWRVQMNNLVNRLGDLHEANVPTGGWVRIYGGSLDFDDRHLDSDYIGVQAGVDFKVGAGWTLGAALSYTDGDADYRNGGSSDAYAYDFALYGTWMHENGLYVDLVGKVGRVSNDSDINMHVCDSFIHGSDSYDATAWGLSAEVGWKVPVTEMFFIEPQAQLSYAHISSESADFGDYSADYDSIDMLIGRLGVRTGFELPDDHGSIYLRANVLQDFNGDVDSTLTYDCGSVHQKVSSDEDMDDAWFEVGLGATVKFTDNFYLYAECTYADGGDVDSVYGNLGARLMF